MGGKDGVGREEERKAWRERRDREVSRGGSGRGSVGEGGKKGGKKALRVICWVNCSSPPPRSSPHPKPDAPQIAKANVYTTDYQKADCATGSDKGWL